MSVDYSPPQKPKVPVLLCPITSAYALEPYVLAINDKEKYLETGEVDYENDFAVAVGQLKAVDYSDFERIFGFTLKTAIIVCANIIMLMKTGDAESKGMLKEIGLWYDEDEGVFHTPAGKTKKSPETMYLEIAAFCLSRFGRIEGVENGEFKLSPVDYETVFQELNPQMLNMVDEEGNSPFDKLLELTGIVVNDTLKEKDEEEVSLTPKPEKKVRQSRGKRGGAEKTSQNSEKA